MSCCINILRLDRVDICGGFVATGKDALATGNHELRFDYLGQPFKIIANITVGNEIKFPANNLNEDYIFTGQVYGPDGGKITFTVDSIVYDCLEFQTCIVYDAT